MKISQTNQMMNNERTTTRVESMGMFSNRKLNQNKIKTPEVRKRWNNRESKNLLGLSLSAQEETIFAANPIRTKTREITKKILSERCSSRGFGPNKYVLSQSLVKFKI